MELSVKRWFRRTGGVVLLVAGEVSLEFSVFFIPGSCPVRNCKHRFNSQGRVA